MTQKGNGVDTENRARHRGGDDAQQRPSAKHGNSAIASSVPPQRTSLRRLRPPLHRRLRRVVARGAGKLLPLRRPPRRVSPAQGLRGGAVLLEHAGLHAALVLRLRGGQGAAHGHLRVQGAAHLQGEAAARLRLDRGLGVEGRHVARPGRLLHALPLPLRLPRPLLLVQLLQAIQRRLLCDDVGGAGAQHVTAGDESLALQLIAQPPPLGVVLLFQPSCVRKHPAAGIEAEPVVGDYVAEGQQQSRSARRRPCSGNSGRQADSPLLNLFRRFKRVFDVTLKLRPLGGEQHCQFPSSFI